MRVFTVSECKIQIAGCLIIIVTAHKICLFLCQYSENLKINTCFRFHREVLGKKIMSLAFGFSLTNT